jgi:pimeloyl-ACP methyl ester carboxylesterase
MGHLGVLVLALGVLVAAAAAHLLFWGWFYRLRADSDALLTARCADGWVLTVAHFKPRTPSPLPPVILCHGLAANRWNLSLPGEHSLAGYLRDQGHEVFCCDLRGVGDARRPPAGKHASDVDFDAHVEQDAPAVIDLALQTSGKPRALWVGHSMGGLVGLAAAQGPHAGRLAGVAALGSPTRWEYHRKILGRVVSLSVWLSLRGRVHQKWPLRLVAPWLGYFPIPMGDISLNPQNIDGALFRRVAYRVVDDVPRKLLAQFRSWFRRNAWDLGEGRVDLRRGLSTIRCPVLLVGGTLDVLAPPQAMHDALRDVGAADKTLLLFGKARGDQQDYGHGDLIFGRHAPREVFPQLLAWLTAHGT